MNYPRLKAILASLGLMVLAGAASAQDYPSKPINLIVPWPAGGPTDITMRAMAEAAAKHLGQPIVIENKAGGGGTVGPATMAASAKPDGYTLAQMPITVYRLPLMQKTTWKADDFTYIIHLTGYVFAVFAGADTPFKTWEDVIAYAKANPGKITYGSTGSGTSLHLGMEMLAEKSGVKFTHVPFKGAAEVNAAVAGGHVMLGASGTSIKPLVDAGKARFLNVWTAKRVSFLPEIPTLQDLGYPYVIDSPWGLAGPKGMDPKVVAKIHDAFRKALQEQPVIDTLARFDMVPNYKNTADYNAAVAEQIKLEEALLKRIGLERKD
ncbi:tripartite tricarboxylate transporter substrate binding protein [Bradyrhizobium sp. LHD-71]|uniref:Bug family tripartite tricarboxylate transporter substrate binding protein n=1 Tax=Bradyrhizobium sp. LHD-71 TaxID=3072141 RepID=UPI00280D187E|nr:tripartite tricarboxylate transporter substrate binding protein [Bradyrhizobium sp. LHD-71]MDQ8728385.1 tripartite tricarboxylate transporter substrate binding protein [Bradyrhizobium sp. LHD-71]